jgi:hypothetical protein
MRRTVLQVEDPGAESVVSGPASDHARMITGEVIRVDAGQYI